jgi:hypothetical protein
MNSDLYKFNCSLHCFAYFDGDPEVNVTRKLFYQKKTMEYSHWVLRKSNAKSMDIDMETNFASIVYGGKRV